MINPMQKTVFPLEKVFIGNRTVRYINEFIPGIIPNMYTIDINGNVWSYFRNNYKSPSPDKDGYFRVGFRCIDNSTKWLHIHRLVAMAFIPIPERLQEYSYDTLVVNHINGIKTDNRFGNLEWCTAVENTYHANNTGLNNNRGESVYNSRFTNEQVLFIADRLLENYSYYDICKMINLEPTEENMLLIGRIKTKYSYSSITKDYDFSNYHSGVGKTFTDAEVHKICEFFQMVNETNMYNGKRYGVKEAMNYIGKIDWYNSLDKNKQQLVSGVISRLKKKSTYPDICNQYNY